MNNILFVFLSLSLSGSVLELILLALKPLVKSRLSQTWQYYIWLIIILRFLLPFTPQDSVVGEMSRYVQNISNSPAAVEVDPAVDGNEKYTVPQAPQTLQATAPQNTEAQTSVQPAFWRDILNNVWMLWISMALMLFVHKVTSYRSFIRFVKVGMKSLRRLYRPQGVRQGPKRVPMVRTSFIAGWQAAGGDPPTPHKIFEIVQKKESEESK